MWFPGADLYGQSFGSRAAALRRSLAPGKRKAHLARFHAMVAVFLMVGALMFSGAWIPGVACAAEGGPVGKTSIAPHRVASSSQVLHRGFASAERTSEPAPAAEGEGNKNDSPAKASDSATQDAKNAKDDSIFADKPPLVWLELGTTELEKSVQRFLALKPAPDFFSKCDSECPETKGRDSSDKAALTREAVAKMEETYKEFVQLHAKRKKFTDEVDKLNMKIDELRDRRRMLEKQERQAGDALADARKGNKPEVTIKAARALTKAKDQITRVDTEVRRTEGEIAKTRQDRDKLDEEWDQLRTRKDESGFTLLEFVIKAGDRAKIDWLLSREEEAGQTMRLRLLAAVAANDAKRAAELLQCGADVYQEPGSYSALAFATIFGEGRIMALLAKSGARIEVPWDMSEPTTEELLAALENQMRRVEAFSASIGTPHPSTRGKIERLQCQVECIKKVVKGNQELRAQQ